MASNRRHQQTPTTSSVSAPCLFAAASLIFLILMTLLPSGADATAVTPPHQMANLPSGVTDCSKVQTANCTTDQAAFCLSTKVVKNAVLSQPVCINKCFVFGDAESCQANKDFCWWNNHTKRCQNDCSVFASTTTCGKYQYNSTGCQNLYLPMSGIACHLQCSYRYFDSPTLCPTWSTCKWDTQTKECEDSCGSLTDKMTCSKSAKGCTWLNNTCHKNCAYLKDTACTSHNGGGYCRYNGTCLPVCSVYDGDEVGCNYAAQYVKNQYARGCVYTKKTGRCYDSCASLNSSSACNAASDACTFVDSTQTCIGNCLEENIDRITCMTRDGCRYNTSTDTDGFCGPECNYRSDKSTCVNGCKWYEGAKRYNKDPDECKLDCSVFNKTECHYKAYSGCYWNASATQCENMCDDIRGVQPSQCPSNCVPDRVSFDTAGVSRCINQCSWFQNLTEVFPFSQTKCSTLTCDWKISGTDFPCAPRCDDDGKFNRSTCDALGPNCMWQGTITPYSSYRCYKSCEETYLSSSTTRCYASDRRPGCLGYGPGYCFTQCSKFNMAKSGGCPYNVCIPYGSACIQNCTALDSRHCSKYGTQTGCLWDEDAKVCRASCDMITKSFVNNSNTSCATVNPVCYDDGNATTKGCETDCVKITEESDCTVRGCTWSISSNSCRKGCGDFTSYDECNAQSYCMWFNQRTTETTLSRWNSKPSCGRACTEYTAENCPTLTIPYYSNRFCTTLSVFDPKTKNATQICYADCSTYFYRMDSSVQACPPRFCEDYGRGQCFDKCLAVGNEYSVNNASCESWYDCSWVGGTCKQTCDRLTKVSECPAHCMIKSTSSSTRLHACAEPCEDLKTSSECASAKSRGCLWNITRSACDPPCKALNGKKESCLAYAWKGCAYDDAVDACMLKCSVYKTSTECLADVNNNGCGWSSNEERCFDLSCSYNKSACEFLGDSCAWHGYNKSHYPSGTTSTSGKYACYFGCSQWSRRTTCVDSSLQNDCEWVPNTTTSSSDIQGSCRQSCDQLLRPANPPSHCRCPHTSSTCYEKCKDFISSSACFAVGSCKWTKTVSGPAQSGACMNSCTDFHGDEKNCEELSSYCKYYTSIGKCMPKCDVLQAVQPYPDGTTYCTSMHGCRPHYDVYTSDSGSVKANRTVCRPDCNKFTNAESCPSSFCKPTNTWYKNFWLTCIDSCSGPKTQTECYEYSRQNSGSCMWIEGKCQPKCSQFQRLGSSTGCPSYCVSYYYSTYSGKRTYNCNLDCKTITERGNCVDQGSNCVWDSIESKCYHACTSTLVFRKKDVCEAQSNVCRWVASAASPHCDNDCSSFDNDRIQCNHAFRCKSTYLSPGRSICTSTCKDNSKNDCAMYDDVCHRTNTTSGYSTRQCANTCGGFNVSVCDKVPGCNWYTAGPNHTTGCKTSCSDLYRVTCPSYCARASGYYCKVVKSQPDEEACLYLGEYLCREQFCIWANGKCHRSCSYNKNQSSCEERAHQGCVWENTYGGGGFCTVECSLGVGTQCSSNSGSFVNCSWRTDSDGFKMCTPHCANHYSHNCPTSSCMPSNTTSSSRSYQCLSKCSNFNGNETACTAGGQTSNTVCMYSTFDNVCSTLCSTVRYAQCDQPALGGMCEKLSSYQCKTNCSAMKDRLSCLGAYATTNILYGPCLWDPDTNRCGKNCEKSSLSSSQCASSEYASFCLYNPKVRKCKVRCHIAGSSYDACPTSYYDYCQFVMPFPFTNRSQGRCVDECDEFGSYTSHCRKLPGCAVYSSSYSSYRCFANCSQLGTADACDSRVDECQWNGTSCQQRCNKIRTSSCPPTCQKSGSYCRTICDKLVTLASCDANSCVWDTVTKKCYENCESLPATSASCTTDPLLTTTSHEASMQAYGSHKRCKLDTVAGVSGNKAVCTSNCSIPGTTQCDTSAPNKCFSESWRSASTNRYNYYCAADCTKYQPSACPAHNCQVLHLGPKPTSSASSNYASCRTRCDLPLLNGGRQNCSEMSDNDCQWFGNTKKCQPKCSMFTGKNGAACPIEVCVQSADYPYCRSRCTLLSDDHVNCLEHSDCMWHYGLSKCVDSCTVVDESGRLPSNTSCALLPWCPYQTPLKSGWRGICTPQCDLYGNYTSCMSSIAGTYCKWNSYRKKCIPQCSAYNSRCPKEAGCTLTNSTSSYAACVMDCTQFSDDETTCSQMTGQCVWLIGEQRCAINCNLLSRLATKYRPSHCDVTYSCTSRDNCRNNCSLIGKESCGVITNDCDWTGTTCAVSCYRLGYTERRAAEYCKGSSRPNVQQPSPSTNTFVAPTQPWPAPVIDGELERVAQTPAPTSPPWTSPPWTNSPRTNSPYSPPRTYSPNEPPAQTAYATDAPDEPDVVWTAFMTLVFAGSKSVYTRILSSDRYQLEQSLRDDIRYNIPRPSNSGPVEVTILNMRAGSLHANFTVRSTYEGWEVRQLLNQHMNKQSYSRVSSMYDAAASTTDQNFQVDSLQYRYAVTDNTPQGGGSGGSGASGSDGGGSLGGGTIAAVILGLLVVFAVFGGLAYYVVTNGVGGSKRGSSSSSSSSSFHQHIDKEMGALQAPLNDGNLYEKQQHQPGAAGQQQNLYREDDVL